MIVQCSGLRADNARVVSAELTLLRPDKAHIINDDVTRYRRGIHPHDDRVANRRVERHRVRRAVVTESTRLHRTTGRERVIHVCPHESAIPISGREERERIRAR